MQIRVLCEGFTEEAFCKRVLAPHLLGHGSVVTPTVVNASLNVRGQNSKGGGDWTKYKSDLLRLKQSDHPGSRTTTLIDLYSLPRGFPLPVDLSPSPSHRAREVEVAMQHDVDWPELLAHVQLYEFESLLFTDLSVLHEQIDDSATLTALRRLAEETRGQDPESINDGQSTAPSKRILKAAPAFKKRLHGVPACEAIGLERVRGACPHFNEWLNQLEALG